MEDSKIIQNTFMLLLFVAVSVSSGDSIYSKTTKHAAFGNDDYYYYGF
jgi:hypothetical protein